jgi:hypothetical protein
MEFVLLLLIGNIFFMFCFILFFSNLFAKFIKVLEKIADIYEKNSLNTGQ